MTGTTLSGITDQRSYNAFGEPDSYEALSGSTQLYKASYKRDSLGRIVEKTETVEGTSTTYAYSYDEEGSLKEVKTRRRGRRLLRLRRERQPPEPHHS